MKNKAKYPVHKGNALREASGTEGNTKTTTTSYAVGSQIGLLQENNQLNTSAT